MNFYARQWSPLLGERGSAQTKDLPSLWAVKGAKAIRACPSPTLWGIVQIVLIYLPLTRVRVPASNNEASEQAYDLPEPTFLARYDRGPTMPLEGPVELAGRHWSTGRLATRESSLGRREPPL